MNLFLKLNKKSWDTTRCLNCTYIIYNNYKINFILSYAQGVHYNIYINFGNFLKYK